MFSRVKFYFGLLTVLLACINALAQEVVGSTADRMSPSADSLLYRQDTTHTPVQSTKNAVVDEPLIYHSSDSSSMDFKNQRVYLYSQGSVEYQDLELNADYIESNLLDKEISAKGKTDTSGLYSGKPVFKQGGEEYETDSLIYNITSGRGLIYNVVTKQGEEGILHSPLTKRDSSGRVHIKGAKYTTCTADNPHFYLQLSKGIVIPEDKIVIGPSYLVIADVPIPILGLPFGFFPNTTNRKGGLILPTYGDMVTRGFYLRNGGWYQPITDYADLRVTGDIYTRGSWAVNVGTNYKWRYHFNGNMMFNYSLVDDNYEKDFNKQRSYRWRWTHTQDPKANPTQSFTASVNFSSSGYDRNSIAYDSRELMNTQKTSNINFTKNFQSIPFVLNLSASASQNKSDSSVYLKLPEGSFNMTSPVYPFRKKEGTGQYKWYENISINYSSQFRSELNTIDTALFYRETWENAKAGFRHSIPVSLSLKSKRVKMFSAGISANYNGVLYPYYVRKNISGDMESGYELVSDTIHKIVYAHSVSPAFSTSLTPKRSIIYSNSRENPKLIAVRHVISPSVSFSYTPDVSGINPDYHDTIRYMQNGRLVEYNYGYFDENIYGTPSFSGRSGSVSFSLGNNLEAKLKAKDDTASDAKDRKITLVRSLNLSTSYRPYAESFKWSDVTASFSTSLFNGNLSIQAGATFSPYDMDSIGRRIDEYNIKNGKRLLRFTRLSLSPTLNIQSAAGKKEQSDGQETSQVMGNSTMDPEYYDPDYEFLYGTGTYVDFNIPWSLSLQYSYAISRPGLKENQTFVNNVNVNGRFSLTPKWNFSVRSGYDFVKKEMSNTSVNISRDLHCWQMSFNVSPFGYYRYYNFTIRAKSNLLRDLKVDKKSNWQDNF